MTAGDNKSMVIVIILTKVIHFVHKPRGQKFMDPPPFPLCLFVSNFRIFDDPPSPPLVTAGFLHGP